MTICPHCGGNDLFGCRQTCPTHQMAKPIDVGDWVTTPDGSYVQVVEIVDQVIVEFVEEGRIAYDRKELTLADPPIADCGS